MKTKYIVVGALLLSMSTFAQKDEMKSLKKIYEKPAPSAKDVVEYKANVTKAEPLMANETQSHQVYFQFYKANIPFVEMSEAMAKPENSKDPMAAGMKFFTPAKIASLAEASSQVLEFEKTSGKVMYTNQIQQKVAQFKPMLFNYAIELSDQKRFLDAASVLHSMYLLDKKDPENLYYAANYAITGQDSDKALAYYTELKNINYSGEKTVYYAKSKVNDDKNYFPSKSDRDKAVQIGSHSTPTEEKVPSKRGEIYKNIAILLLQQDKVEEAKQAIADAKLQNPDDSSLLLTEADLYLKLKDDKTYARIISEVLEKDPNNKELVFNLGITSKNNKDFVNAEKYFLRVLEIDPNFTNAHLLLGAQKIDEAQLILEQMNKLGTTQADNKKYDILKKQRDAILLKSIDYLEKYVALEPTAKEAKTTLLSVYNALEMTDKAKALKATMN